MPFPNIFRRQKANQVERANKQLKGLNKHRKKDSEEAIKTEALHAFRTIVMMLSLIQSKRVSNGNPDVISPKSKEELAILDALACVCVRRNEVVAALSTKHATADRDIQVLLSVFFNKESLTVSQQTPQSSNQVMGNVKSFFVTHNPRKTTTDKHAIIVHPEIEVPKHLTDCASNGDRLLTTYLIREW
jgi:hypothetical protein